jgi:hypothetical protein
MSAGSFAILVAQPHGEGWRELADEWYVDVIGEVLSLPTARILIRLKPEVTLDQARDIANDVMSRLDGGVVTVEYRQYDK